MTIEEDFETVRAVFRPRSTSIKKYDRADAALSRIRTAMEELERTRDAWLSTGVARGVLERAALRTEVERLREALVEAGELAGHMRERSGASLARIVRQALQGKGETE